MQPVLGQVKAICSYFLFSYLSLLQTASILHHYKTVFSDASSWIEQSAILGCYYEWNLFTPPQRLFWMQNCYWHSEGFMNPISLISVELIPRAQLGQYLDIAPRWCFFDRLTQTYVWCPCQIEYQLLNRQEWPSNEC